jgi:hypothetical protein
MAAHRSRRGRHAVLAGLRDRRAPDENIRWLRIPFRTQE